MRVPWKHLASNLGFQTTTTSRQPAFFWGGGGGGRGLGLAGCAMQLSDLAPWLFCQRPRPGAQNPLHACLARSNTLDRATALALAGLPCLRALRVHSLLPGYGREEGHKPKYEMHLHRREAAECAAVVAALPPRLRELVVGVGMGSCVEGAALVVPPGRAQQLELRCGPGKALQDEGRLRTGRQGTAEDVRAFLSWHGPGGAAQVKTLVLGGCRGPRLALPLAPGVARGAERGGAWGVA
jgi:hypothetical protein